MIDIEQTEESTAVKQSISLLDRARQIDSKMSAAEATRPQRLIAECELAVSYYKGEIYSGAVAKVLRFKKTAQVGAWASGVIMKGIRHGIIEFHVKSGVKPNG